jgi:hypothetical protein
MRSAIRSLGVLWSAVLICFMATGTFSTARIGAMTWGVAHDVWSATIAISQINFRLPGKLGFHEIEQAIANQVTSTKSVWNATDAASKALANDPEAVTRGLKVGAAVKESEIVIPDSKQGYLTDWCEDLGYADFYNLAFRLFGVNAYSTHWLYFSILALAFGLFVTTFWRDEVAVTSVTLLITALFLISTSSLFSEKTPSFAANRFVSTLAVIPLIHLVFVALRSEAIDWREFAGATVQAMLLVLVIAARSSAQWCAIAIVGSTIVVSSIRYWGKERSQRLVAWLTQKDIRRLRVVGGLVVGLFVVGAVRPSLIDERYFWDDNMPHHLTWHSAYLGLTFHPEWPLMKPYADLPDSYEDSVAFGLFTHRMQETGRPYAASWRPGYYLAREHEKLMRSEYLRFVWDHPRYMLELMLYEKPKLFLKIVEQTIISIKVEGWVSAFPSLLLSAALLLLARGGRRISECVAGFGIIWCSSMLPMLWAYPAPHVAADQNLTTLFLMLVGASFFLSEAAKGVDSIVSTDAPNRAALP